MIVDEIRSEVEQAAHAIYAKLLAALRSTELASELNVKLDLPGLPEGVEQQVIAALLNRAADVLEAKVSQ